MHVRRPIVAALVVATAGATAACSSGAALTATLSGTPDYSCQDITVPAHTLTDGRRASELSAAGRRTVLQTEGVTRANLETWRIVEDSSARVTIIRPLDRPERVGDRVVASHQYVDRTPYRKADLARSRWTVAIPLTCTLRELVDPAPAPAAPKAKVKAKEPPSRAPQPKAPGTRAPGWKSPAVQAPAAESRAGKTPAVRAPALKPPAAKAPPAKSPAPAAEKPTVKALPQPKG